MTRKRTNRSDDGARGVGEVASPSEASDVDVHQDKSGQYEVCVQHRV